MEGSAANGAMRPKLFCTAHSSLTYYFEYLFYWSVKCTLTYELHTCTSSQEKKRPRWEGTQRKGYGDSKVGTRSAEYSKDSLWVHDCEFRQAGSSGGRLGFQQSKSCGVDLDTKLLALKIKHSNSLMQLLPLFPHIALAAGWLEVQSTITLSGQRSGSSGKCCWVPVTYAWPHLPWLLQISTSDKILSVFFWKVTLRQETLPHL